MVALKDKEKSDNSFYIMDFIMKRSICYFTLTCFAT